MPAKVTVPLTAKSPVATIRFGPPPPLKGLAGELQAAPSPVGHSYNWRNFLERADDVLLEALHEAFLFDGGNRDLALVAAFCESFDGMGRFTSRSGGLKATAVRFAYHAISTIGTCVEHSPVPREVRWFRDSVASSVQFSYRLLTPPTGKQPRGALTPEEMRLARSACVAYFATESGEKTDLSDIAYMAEHYEALENYVSVIVAEKDMSRHFLESLVAVQPTRGLLSGML
jgi:hypothetical protein